MKIFTIVHCIAMASIYINIMNVYVCKSYISAITFE